MYKWYVNFKLPDFVGVFFIHQIDFSNVLMWTKINPKKKENQDGTGFNEFELGVETVQPHILNW